MIELTVCYSISVPMFVLWLCNRAEHRTRRIQYKNAFLVSKLTERRVRLQLQKTILEDRLNLARYNTVSR